jgi:hypothetical protein
MHVYKRKARHLREAFSMKRQEVYKNDRGRPLDHDPADRLSVSFGLVYRWHGRGGRRFVTGTSATSVSTAHRRSQLQPVHG